MAQELAPIDEQLRQSGIYVPLPLNPFVPSSFPDKEDRHHTFFPADAPELHYVEYQHNQLALNPRAVRWSRIQQGNALLHRMYHHQYEEVPLPQTDEERFKTMLLCSAGYVPQLAVNPIGQSQIVKVTERMRDHLQTHGRIRQDDGRRWQVGLFFGNYIIQNGMDAVKETAEAAQFMETTDQFKRWTLGFSVLRIAAQSLLDDIEPQYERARRQGQINPHRSPPRALRFLMKHFDNRQPDYQQALQESLSVGLEA